MHKPRLSNFNPVDSIRQPLQVERSRRVGHQRFLVVIRLADNGKARLYLEPKGSTTLRCNSPLLLWAASGKAKRKTKTSRVLSVLLSGGMGEEDQGRCRCGRKGIAIRSSCRCLSGASQLLFRTQSQIALVRDLQALLNGDHPDLQA